MIGQYRANVYDPDTFELQTVIEDWQRLQLRHLINGVSSSSIQLYGGHPASEYLIKNALIEVWRRVPGYIPAAIPSSRQRENNWYVEWSGLVDDTYRTVYQNSNDVLTVYAYSLLGLIQRREVLWYATIGASESKKVTIPAQTAIYQFVEENLGASATAVAGRLIDGTMTGMIIPVLIGGGNNWSGMRAWRNVLEVIQEIGNFGSIDFDVVSNDGGGFTFETYPNQLGEDRTNVGLDPTTGKNAEGNVPVVFSLERENVLEITHKVQNSQSMNVIVTAGQGQYGARATGISQDATLIDANRINQREMVRNASSQEDAAELDTMADEWLVRTAPIDDIDFTPRTTQSTIYGIDYWLGDKLTAMFEDVERNKRLSSLVITVDKKRGETFSGWKFDTIP